MPKNEPFIDLGHQTIVVISDVHLSSRFNQTKYNSLVSAINSGDRLIINGDFWDGYKTNYNAFIKSEWQELFPLLKEKQTIYLYGNHDPKKYDTASLFSAVQGDSVTIRQNYVDYHFEHGDRISPTIDLIVRMPRKIRALGNVFEGLAVRLFGERYLKIYRHANQTMMEWKKDNLKQEEWLICGHSHLAECLEESRFANSGLFNWGYGQYLIINDSGVQKVCTRYS